MNLSEAVEAEGYRLVVDPEPWARPDVLGNPHEPELWPHCVLLCVGNILAATGDGWDWAYSAAHEIAEDRCGHEHTAEMWAEQAGLLGRWIAMAGERGPVMA